MAYFQKQYYFKSPSVISGLLFNIALPAVKV